VISLLHAIFIAFFQLYIFSNNRLLAQSAHVTKSNSTIKIKPRNEKSISNLVIQRQILASNTQLNFCKLKVWWNFLRFVHWVIKLSLYPIPPNAFFQTFFLIKFQKLCHFCFLVHRELTLVLFTTGNFSLLSRGGTYIYLLYGDVLLVRVGFFAPSVLDRV